MEDEVTNELVLGKEEGSKSVSTNEDGRSGDNTNEDSAKEALTLLSNALKGDKEAKETFFEMLNGGSSNEQDSKNKASEEVNDSDHSKTEQDDSAISPDEYISAVKEKAPEIYKGFNEELVAGIDREIDAIAGTPKGLNLTKTDLSAHLLEDYQKGVYQTMIPLAEARSARTGETVLEAYIFLAQNKSELDDMSQKIQNIKSNQVNTENHEQGELSKEAKARQAEELFNKYVNRN